MVLFPGQWHTYAPLQKTGWNEYYIGFEGPIIDNLVKNSFISKESQILDSLEHLKDMETIREVSSVIREY